MGFTNYSFIQAVHHMKHLLKHGASERTALRQACGKYKIPYSSQAAIGIKQEVRKLLRKEKP